MEVANLIISIFSLIATIAISFVIYFLECHNQKLIDDKEIKEKAKKFILDNSNELDYLHWATVAVGCFPQNNHVRKIYNEFAFLDKETREEVLKEREINCELISNDKWIDSKINLIIDAIEKLGIGDDFLYDNGKYFTRAYDYKEQSIKELEHKKYSNDIYNDYFHLNRMFLKNKDHLTYTQYLEDYLYCKFDKPELMPRDNDIPLPNDYLLAAENLRNCREDYLCYWMMVMVENVDSYAIRYLEYTEEEHSQTDAQIETYEDMYFSILYDLYYLENNQKNQTWR